MPLIMAAPPEDNQSEMDRMRHQLELMGAWKEGILAARDHVPPVIVRASKERKLRRFAGASAELSDWIEDAKASIDELTDNEATLFLWRHVEGIAREEIRMYAVSERDTSEQIFDLLQQAFGERRSDLQIKRELYDRYQGKKETLRSYSRALTELVNHLSSVSEIEKNKMLVEVFTDNIRDRYLRNELRKKCRETPEVGFTQLRDFAIEVMPNECQEVGERASVRVNSVIAGVSMYN